MHSAEQRFDRRGWWRELGFLCLSLTVVAIAVIWVRTATVKKTYEYVQHEKELRQLEQEIQALRIEWLKWTAPERLEDLAEMRDLHRPIPEQVYRYASPKTDTAGK